MSNEVTLQFAAEVYRDQIRWGDTLTQKAGFLLSGTTLVAGTSVSLIRLSQTKLLASTCASIVSLVVVLALWTCIAHAAYFVIRSLWTRKHKNIYPLEDFLVWRDNYEKYLETNGYDAQQASTLADDALFPRLRKSLAKAARVNELANISRQISVNKALHWLVIALATLLVQFFAYVVFH